MNYIVKKTSLILLLAFFITTGSLFALGSSGATAFVFLNNGFGARASGMGKAFVAVANDVSCIYWNPSALVNLKEREIMAMHASLFSNLVYYDVIGYTQRIRNLGNVGFGFVTLNVPGIRYYSNDGTPGDQFIDSENAVFVSYGYKFNKQISLGGSLKTIYHRIYKYSGLGLAIDAAATYLFAYDLKFALVLENLLSTGIKFNAPGASRSYALPKIRLGASYRGLRDMVLAVGIDQQIKGPFYYFLGAEYDVLKYFDVELKLRAGFDNERITTGFGLNYMNYNFDYAYAYSLSKNFIGNSHRFSVAAKF